MRRFLTSLLCAVAGIGYGLRTQRHLRFHCFAGLCAVLLGFCSRLSGVQWGLLILTIAAVLAAELFNTAVEAVVDLVSPAQHPLAKAAKDTAAGAVLVLAMAALLVAVLLFVPSLLTCIMPR